MSAPKVTPRTVQPDPRDDELMRTADVAEYFRCSVETVHYWRNQGTGPHGTRVGRNVLYRRGDVRAWFQRQADEQAADRGAA